MTDLRRRDFLGLCVRGAAAASLGLPAVARAQESAPTPLGTLKPRPSLDIRASHLSVGLEVLDRRMYDPVRILDPVGESGAKWARVQTGWNRCETVKGQYDFSWLDPLIDGLLKRGVQPWFNLGYGNQLYMTDAPQVSAVGWFPHTEEQRAAWLSFVEAIARHYSGRVRHWELWNEPNIEGFWKPDKPSAAAYMELVRLTAPQVRVHNEDCVLIGGAFAGMPTPYFKECLDLGLATLVDKISYHPYRPVPEQGNYAKVVADWRALLAEAPGVALWQGENGCPSVPGGSGALADLQWNEERQAKWVLRRLLLDLSLEIELTSYYHTVDLTGYSTTGKPGTTNYKGLLRATDYSPKPSYRCYQFVATLFDADTKRTQANVKLAPAVGELPEVQTAAFEREGKGLFVFWRPTSPLDDTPEMRLTVTLPPEAVRDPVWADLMSGRIYAAPNARQAADGLTIPGIPLRDYPVLVTDRAITGP
jgi:hypothetical protein